MTLSQQQADDLHDEITRHLEKIERLFKPGAKLTLIVRCPDQQGDASVLVTSDDPEMAIAEIQKRMREPSVETGGLPAARRLTAKEIDARRPRGGRR